VPGAEPALPVLRRRDLVGLFDTEADLSGIDLDVSAYIRDDADLDVSVAWRAIEGDAAPADRLPPQPDELCRVAVTRFRAWCKKQPVWRWDGLTGRWEKVDGQRVAPGTAVIVPTAAGGYDPHLGFTGEPKHRPIPWPLDTSDRLDAADEDDPLTHLSAYLPLEIHADDAAQALSELAVRLADAAGTPWAELERAARWHDLGKAHPVFQEALVKGLAEGDPRRGGGPWAKSDGVHGGRAGRRHFRHELASALAFIEHGATDLQAYVVAAYHGKARITIRSRPTEPTDADGRRPVLGVMDGDQLPGCELGGGERSEPTRLSLDLLALGGGGGASWAARTSGLLAAHGPFRLAWCEALIRVADWTASRKRRGPHGGAK
jgi:CRISPR-associated endonuclease/helicase Cas3